MINKINSEILRSRRTTYPRYFNGDRIKDSVVTEILENANYAPSHRMTQPWFFKIFCDDNKKNLAKAIVNVKSNTSFEKKIYENFEKTSHIICVCMKRHEQIVPEWEEIAATAMSVQNIWLSIVNSSIGGYWSTPKYISNLDNFLKLEDNEKCLGFFYLGVVKSFEPRSVSRHSISKKIIW